MKVHDSWGGVLPTLYDPGVPRFNKEPNGLFDGVLCTDVMEHIPEGVVPEIVADIFQHASKFVFLSIALDWSPTLLSNGISVHCCVKPVDWWKGVLELCPVRMVVCFGTKDGFDVWTKEPT